MIVAAASWKDRVGYGLVFRLATSNAQLRRLGSAYCLASLASVAGRDARRRPSPAPGGDSLQGLSESGLGLAIATAIVAVCALSDRPIHPNVNTRSKQTPHWKTERQVEKKRGMWGPLCTRCCGAEACCLASYRLRRGQYGISITGVLF